VATVIGDSRVCHCRAASYPYRSENRYTVFQALAHTVEGLDRTAVRIFAKSHNERNLAEYEGRTEVDKQLLKELIRYATELQKVVAALDPPAK